MCVCVCVCVCVRVCVRVCVCYFANGNPKGLFILPLFPQKHTHTSTSGHAHLEKLELKEDLFVRLKHTHISSFLSPSPLPIHVYILLCVWTCIYTHIET